MTLLSTNVRNQITNFIVELKEATTAWDSMLGSSPHKAKVYSLIPFFIESALHKKHFVLRMEVFQKAELLKLETLTMFGVHT